MNRNVSDREWTRRRVLAVAAITIALTGARRAPSASTLADQAASHGGPIARQNGTAAPALAEPAGGFVAPRPATGSVAGVVRLGSGAGSRTPPPLGPYSRRRAVPPRTADHAGDATEAVVFARPDRPASADEGTATVMQRDRTILPFVTVVTAGSRVDFPNEDEVFHNLFSLSGSNRFDLGRYPPGETRSRMFTRPGIVRVFCDIHAEMSAVLFVLDSMHYTQPAADGTYTLTGLPAGAYTLVVWHAGAGADSTRIDVVAGRTTRVDFNLQQAP